MMFEYRQGWPKQYFGWKITEPWYKPITVQVQFEYPNWTVWNSQWRWRLKIAVAQPSNSYFTEHDFCNLTKYIISEFIISEFIVSEFLNHTCTDTAGTRHVHFVLKHVIYIRNYNKALLTKPYSAQCASTDVGIIMPEDWWFCFGLFIDSHILKNM